MDPAIRGSTAPVSGLSGTSPVATAVGDLILVVTFERAGAGVPTHTVDGAGGYTEVFSQPHDDGSTDGRLSIARKVATSGGANSYAGYSTSGSSANCQTGIIVIKAGLFDAAGIVADGVTGTNNAVPNPPAVTTSEHRAYLALAIAAWHLGSAATVAVTPPANYTEIWEVAGSVNIELSAASRGFHGGQTSIDPGAYADDVAPNGTSSVTIAVPLPEPSDANYVQKIDESSSASGTSVGLTVPAGGVAAGNLILIHAARDANGSVASVADSDGVNTYVVDVSDTNQAIGMSIVSCLVTDALEAGDTITVTFTGAAGVVMAAAYEFAPSPGMTWDSPPTDQTAAGGGAATTTFDSGTTAATTEDDELVFAVGSWSAQFVDLEPGTGYTPLSGAQNGSSLQKSAAQYKVVSATGTQQAGGTFSAALTYNGAIATYKMIAGEVPLLLGDIPSAEVVQGVDLTQSGPVALSLGDVPSTGDVQGVNLSQTGPVSLLLGHVDAAEVVQGVDLAPSSLALELGHVDSAEVVQGVDLTQSGPLALSLGDVPSTEVVQGVDITQAGPDVLSLGRVPSAEDVKGINLSVPAAIPLLLGHIEPATFPPVVQPAYKSLRVDAYLGSAAFTTQFNEAVANGAEHVRFSAQWDLIETSNGTFVWTKVDQAVNACVAAGIGCTVHIIKTPAWVGTADQWDPPIHNGTQITHWRDFITQLVTRYGTDISIYEIWNEPNGATFNHSPSAQSAWPGEYADLLRNACEAAKAVDPDVKIGGMVTNRSLVSGFMEGVYDALEADVGIPTCEANNYYYDYLSLHPYCLTHSPSFAAGGDDIADAWGGDIGRSFNDFTRARDIVQAREGVTKPIYFGEFGYNTDGSTNNGPVADATRATYLPLAYDICREDGGVYALTWYSWQDGPAAWDINGKDTEDAFIAYSLSDPPGGGPVYGIELSFGAGVTLSLGAVAAGDSLQGIDLTQSGPVTLNLGHVPSAEDVRGIDLSVAGAVVLSLGRIASADAIQGIDLSQAGAVALLLGRVVSAGEVYGLDLGTVEPDTQIVLRVEFEVGVGQIGYEGGVRLSEYPDGVQVVEF